MGRGLRWSEEQLKAFTEREYPSAPKPSKHKNHKVASPDGKFDSKKEFARWGELKLLEAGGHISNLRRQVPYKLSVNNQLVCTYIADFVYSEGGREVVEDTKSLHTRTFPVYRLKKKLMLACLGISILET